MTPRRIRTRRQAQTADPEFLLSILDTNGLRDAASVEGFLHRRRYADVVSLAGGLSEAIRSNSRSLLPESPASDLDEASFLPSSSMRGDRGCQAWPWACRACAGGASLL